jgi:microcystin-dependent protein
MADTVTTKMGFTKPEIGASNNTWGTKNNGNWDIADSGFVRNTKQWTVTPGDDTANSAAGPWLLTRYNNTNIRIDDPINVNRQTGVVNMSVGMSFTYQGTQPTAPPAGSATIWMDGYGNPFITRPDGTTYSLGTPPGTIAYTAAATADVGWALCNGQAISRTANPYLFARIGSGFGAGDGSTTFNVPDIRGRVIASPDGGTGRLVNAFNGIYGAAGGLDYEVLTIAQIPSHGHSIEINVNTGFESATHAHTVPGVPVVAGNNNNNGGGGGAFAAMASSTATYNTTTETANHYHNIVWNGGADANGGGSWHPNVQPTICLYAQIKLG